MKLLCDGNFAARLVRGLADLCPDSAQVLGLGRAGASDRTIWARAAAGGFAPLTKDEDFHRLSVLLGPPAKVIWIRLGNCATADVARLLRVCADQVSAFVEHAEMAFLALG